MADERTPAGTPARYIVDTVSADGITTVRGFHSKVEPMTPDIVESARAHVAQFEALTDNSVAYPGSVLYARYVISQHAEIERLRASHTSRNDVIEECAKVAESFMPNTTVARKNSGKLIATCIRALRECGQ